VKRVAPAADRNKEPILEVLRAELPERGVVLEVASGSGQHAVFFASALPQHVWQPSDTDPEALESITTYVNEAALPNLKLPLRLDARSETWPVEHADAVVCANMIHIAPWACCLGLFAGAARCLRPGGALVLYGPFRIDGEHTSQSNAEFDASLKARDPSWGVRDCGEVAAVAASSGMSLMERVAMPANNQCLVFQRT
jgi:SAM-dependent methyltransferase